MAEVIKEIDWNGNHYTFTNTFKSTGTKNHDILTMEDDKGNSWTGETTWINRPWHRFDLEEALREVISKAFGPKAKELIEKINSESNSFDSALERFFSEFKPEDITSNSEDTSDTSEEARIKALAKFLDVNVEDITSNGNNEFEYDSDTYLVLTDNEADDEFDERVKNYWDELGIDGVSDYFQDWILENAVDEDFIEEAVKDSIRYEVDDMDDEQVADKLIENGDVTEDEVYDEDGNVRDDVDFDDLRDKLVDSEFDDVDDNLEYLKDIGYGTETFKDHIDDEKVIDALKDDIDVNGGGRGQELSPYDGKEEEQDGFYIYRQD